MSGFLASAMAISVMAEELSSTGLPEECFGCDDREDWGLLNIRIEEMIQNLFGLNICQVAAGKSGFAHILSGPCVCKDVCY